MGTRSIDTRPIPATREIIAAVFPEMRYGEDPDIERYLELRKGGKVAAALAVYNGPLRGRYPDDAARVALLSLRRAGDHRWRELQARLLDALAERLAFRVTSNIDSILTTIRASRLGSAWGALGAVDSLLRCLGCIENPDQALSIIERHITLARLLNDAGRAPSASAARIRDLQSAATLLGEYSALARMERPEEQDFVARSLAREGRRRLESSSHKTSQGGIEEDHDFVARSRAREAARRDRERSHGRFFDLERLRFSAADKARIELANPPSRHEDLVLAWCLKYWRLALDAGFERTIFLYSSKFRTRHFEIYRELRAGRTRGRSDDEILTALSGLLATGYSYSVTGDIYMQRRWRQLKEGIWADETMRKAAGSVPGSALRDPAGGGRGPSGEARTSRQLHTPT